MMRRIIFVGIHNKPGLEPLASSTRSGKLVDRIISDLPNYVHIKSNFYGFDYFPAQDFVDNHFHFDGWKKRIGYLPGDIVVCLGSMVQRLFADRNIRFVGIRHPSFIWSKIDQDKYVVEAILKIRR